MKKILIFIVLFLIAGLYIDIKSVGPYCNARSFQPSLIIQSIIPFRVDRETLIVGYGEKISNFPLSDYEWDRWYYTSADNQTLQERLPVHMYTECAVYFKNGQLYEGKYIHYIDLKFWEKAK